MKFWGGEFHYWRTPPEAWERVFSSIKSLGFNTVSTYVPWDFHEIVPRRYDLTGRLSPARDLLRWLRLAKKNRLQVILRPGPYIYAEWNDGGPPSRMKKFPRLSPEFLREAAHWIHAVGHAVAGHLVSRGGPIVAMQVCNEVAGMFEFAGWADPKYKGIEKIFREWAREKREFGSKLPRISAHWGGGHLEVPKGKSRLGKEDRDSFLVFNEWYTLEYLRRMTGVFRRAGIDVPLAANLVSWYWPQRWPALQEAVDFVAMDTYYPQGLPGNLPAAFLKLYRHFSGISKLPIAIEFGCGVWDGMHERLGMVDQRHLEFTTLLALSQGVRGISYYMLVNRDNWYLAPINEWGIIRPRFTPVLSRLRKIMKVLSAGSFRPSAPIGLVWSRQDHLDFVASGGKFDHNAFGKEWFESHRYAEDYSAFWKSYEILLAQGYDVEVLDTDATQESARAWPRVTVLPVTPRFDSPLEGLAKLHLRRGGCLVLAGDGADRIALKMPPSIGTPVQKWVRDLPSDKLHRIGKVLEELGERPCSVVEGKELLQFVRADARNRRILFLFSLCGQAQEVTLREGTLKEICSGHSWNALGRITLEGKSGRVFWMR